MDYQKVNEKTLKVIKVETKEEENLYNIDFLKKQEIDILKSKNDFCEARDKELLEVRELIAKCKELDIKSDLGLEEEREELLS